MGAGEILPPADLNQEYLAACLDRVLRDEAMNARAGALMGRFGLAPRLDRALDRILEEVTATAV